MADYRLRRDVSRWNIFKRLRLLEKVIIEFLNPKIMQSVYDKLPEGQKELFEKVPEKKKEEKKDAEIPSKEHSTS